MLENVDEFLLCRPYVGIWSLVVDRVESAGVCHERTLTFCSCIRENPLFFCLPVFVTFLVSHPFYLCRFIPVLSSHCSRWTLIRIMVNSEPWMQRWVARNILIATLLLTYPHVPEQSFRHFSVRRVSIRFNTVLTSVTRRRYTEKKNE